MTRFRLGSLSLEGRLLAASCLLAILVAGVFVAFILALSSLRKATREETQAKNVTTAALQLENLVLDADNALRTYVLTRRPRVLAPYYSAKKQLPLRLSKLQHLVVKDPAQARRVTELSTEIQDYQVTFAEAVLVIAEESFPAARSATKTEGNRRVTDIRMRFAELLRSENARTVDRSESASDRSQRATAIGVAGLSASTVLIILFGLYLARSIAHPVRAAAAGATRFAEGDLSTRLEESGPGEVGELERAFNEMAERLARARRELEAQNTQLRESERLKTELVNTVSHELRTPLASVLGFTSILLSREFGAETRRHYLGIVDAQARRLSSLIDDFLDVRRIEQGRFELAYELLDLGALLHEESELYRGQSGKHRLELALPADPLPVRGDPDRLRQVIGNLLSNAIKYSPDGGIVELAAERDGDAVRIQVRDEGVGIPVKQQPGIFTKFFRGEMAGSGIGGTGLGLAVSRDIVESHGGRIGFTSAEGEGTTFWLELPGANGVGDESPQGEQAQES
jgi:signal transduction histidine kinase